MTKHKVMGYLNLFKTAWQIFVENHPIQFASAFAYFSLYGLPSILLINIFILSFIFDLSDLFEVLRKQVSEVIGADGANILTVVTQNYMEEASKGIFILNCLYHHHIFTSHSTHCLFPGYFERPMAD